LFANPRYLKLFMFSDLSINFFSNASILWRSVIGYYFWQTFKSGKRGDHPYQFVVYNVLVWITAALLIGFDVLIKEQFWDSSMFSESCEKIDFNELHSNIHNFTY